MSLTRYSYDPFVDFDRLFDDAFFTRFFRPTTGATATEGARDLFKPRMDVHENPDTNTVTASFDLPGMTPDKVSIDVNQDRLNISGESSAAQERDERGFTVRERSYGKFARTLLLPQGTKPDDVKAKMEHGVLNVTFPKAQQQQPKRITIQ